MRDTHAISERYECYLRKIEVLNDLFLFPNSLTFRKVKKQTFLRNPNSKIFKINSLKKGEAKEFAKWLVKKI